MPQPLRCIRLVPGQLARSIKGPPPCSALTSHAMLACLCSMLSTQFVLFEQFYENMPGSPGRGGKLGSSSSSTPWGPGAPGSLGHGRQTLHIIGSRAAAVTGVDPVAPDLWVSASRRGRACVQGCLCRSRDVVPHCCWLLARVSLLAACVHHQIPKHCKSAAVLLCPCRPAALSGRQLPPCSTRCSCTQRMPAAAVVAAA